MNSIILIACTSKFTAIYWAEKLQNTPYSATICHTNLTDALTIVTRQPPNLLLAEATFATNRGFELAQQAMIISPALRCVVFVLPGPVCWAQAVLTDVSGYLADPLDDEAELLHCLNEVSDRRRYISPALQRAMLLPSTEILIIIRALKPNQKQLLRLLAQGLTARQIGIEMDLQESTIKTHKENLLVTLKLKTAYELRGFAGSVLGWLS